MAATKEARIPLAIGATVWRIDYGRPGGLTRASQVAVTSETRTSWVLANGVKIPKTQTEPRFDVRGRMSTTPYCLTLEEAEAMVLQHARWHLAAAVKDCIDVATLRKVAEVLGVRVEVEGLS